ncbi:cytochrome d ubiquinol oxidase subunit II [Inquilinus sp. CAU 1745]|uniref:cytochrome d ubiquinol oxidase subunit II n=1 Tax=Inquilinus sp. CAU 1745 TaxID=3140369 RepID=UPI00325AEC46
MTEMLPIIWGGIIAFGIAMYVLMDGFDLGIGILFPFRKDEGDRDVMMNTVAPIWDGNETWLVLGGAGLFGAFPLAYAVILPALYLPLLVMLIALIFRGVAFEFRFRDERHRPGWSLSFILGSVLATFAQGVALGAYVQGFEVSERAFSGGALDWLTPFSLMTGAALVAGYALLGATWLVMKTEGELHRWARKAAERVLMLVVAFMAVVSLWTPFLENDFQQRWFSWPNIAILSPVPLAVAAVSWGIFSGLRRGADWRPFVLSMALFLLGFLGLAISIWPNVIPPEISLQEAAAPPESQIFLLVGVVIVVPIILAYTAYTYWVFRGKVTEDAGYH